jgi:toxin ParE1/3/4
MSRLFFSPVSREDLNGIFDHIAADNPAAAKSFVQRVKTTCQRLSRFPRMGVLREDLAPGVRCLPVGSYLVFYRQVEHRVEIIRVLHGSRDYLGLVD